MDVKIEPSWKALLDDEFQQPYFAQIVSHLKTEKQMGRPFIPRADLSSMRLSKPLSIV